MKRNFVFLVVIGIIAVAALLAGCFSSWTGENSGRITINLGSEARALLGSSEIAGLSYSITLKGPGEDPRSEEAQHGTVLQFEVAPGTWTVDIRAIGDRPSEYDNSTDAFPERMLRAMGSKTVEVEAGKNTAVQIDMVLATEVRSFAQLYYAIEGANSSDKEELIIFTTTGRSEEGTLWIYEPLVIGAGKNISFITDKAITIIKYGFTESLFEIQGGSLTLGKPGMAGSITIDGGKDEDPIQTQAGEPLIRVGDESSLFMYDKVTLTNNFAEGNGGAVEVYSGTFTMNGGVISGNKVLSSGGGVCVTDGTFTMSGNARITDNEADINGGGVYALRSTFNLNGGTIDGSNAESGGGVFVDATVFTMLGGTISNNTATLDGGGVFVDTLSNTNDHAVTFTMQGGTISNNEAGDNGGGVYIKAEGIFNKAPAAPSVNSGIIYGSDDVASAEDKNNFADSGQAVYWAANPPRAVNNTVGETFTMSTDDDTWPN